MREWLKEMRVQRHLTMKQMAVSLGISESYYCSIENGERQKRMDMVLVAGIASALRVPLAEIAQNEIAYLGITPPVEERCNDNL